jgi:selenocysteine lyase/cysteine desulfurase
VITWEALEPLLTERTRLVSLASCHFISGYRIDHATIGRRLHERGVLFCLDAIQTLGAQPLGVEHVDFLAADAHKWLLGPSGAGLFYVAREHQERLRPTLLGSWNVKSPNFIAQREIELHPGARRYEPGTFNCPGIAGMAASLGQLLELGVASIDRRLGELHDLIVARMGSLGFERYLAEMPEEAKSGIVTLRHRSVEVAPMHERLAEAGVAASLRHDREGTALLRFSPHFYNTAEEVERAVACLAAGV